MLISQEYKTVTASVSTKFHENGKAAWGSALVGCFWSTKGVKARCTFYYYRTPWLKAWIFPALIMKVGCLANNLLLSSFTLVVCEMRAIIITWFSVLLLSFVADWSYASSSFTIYPLVCIVATWLPYSLEKTFSSYLKLFEIRLMTRCDYPPCTTHCMNIFCSWSLSCLS